MLELNHRGLPTWNGRRIDLPPKEAAVLAVLIREQPNIVTKQEFAEIVWGRQSMSDESLARCISRIRSVLGDQFGLKLPIKSMYGVGYCLNEQVASTGLRSEGLPGDSPAMRAVLEAHRHAHQLAERRTPAAVQVAVRLLRALIQRYPHYAPARVTLVQAMAGAASWSMQTGTGFIQECLDYLDEVERLDAATPGLNATRASLLDVAWRFDEAAIIWSSVVGELHDNPGIMILYGRHLLSVGKPAAAVDALRRGVQLFPFSALLRTTLARALAYSGEPQAALDVATAASEDHPDSEIAASYRIALLAFICPDASIAATAWRLAELRDASPLSLSIVSYALARLDRRSDALEVIDTCLICHNVTPCMAVLHAPALAALGQLERGAALMMAACDARCGVLPLALRDPVNATLLETPQGQQVMATVFKRMPRTI